MPKEGGAARSPSHEGRGQRPGSSGGPGGPGGPGQALGSVREPAAFGGRPRPCCLWQLCTALSPRSREHESKGQLLWPSLCICWMKWHLG